MLCRTVSGNCAVCTEQSASASHIAAAKVMDVISRLPRCSGQASDAVCAKHASRNERRTSTSSPFGGGFPGVVERNTESKEDQNIGIQLTIQWPRWSAIFCGHPLAGLHG